MQWRRRSWSFVYNAQLGLIQVNVAAEQAGRDRFDTILIANLRPVAHLSFSMLARHHLPWSTFSMGQEQGVRELDRLSVRSRTLQQPDGR